MVGEKRVLWQQQAAGCSSAGEPTAHCCLLTSHTGQQLTDVSFACRGDTFPRTPELKSFLSGMEEGDGLAGEAAKELWLSEQNWG